MPRRPLVLTTSAADLADVFAAIRTRLDVPGPFPDPALADAEAAATDPPRPPDDLRDLPLVTIDPPESRDLDQALHLARRDEGFRIHYAIADVPAFVRPGSDLDDEVRRRGVTHYGPDHHSPLHPPALGEDAASLLPDGDRPAIVWRLDLDGAGVLVATSVRRALVRSRAKLSYEQVQAELDAGTAGDMLSLLPLVGATRRDVERDRGGIALPIPDQEIERVGDRYRLEFRRSRPVEEDNAQLSLLTGMAAAGIMRAGRVGIQRTLPPADDRTHRRLRAAAAALDLDWPGQTSFPDLVRDLDPAVATHAAFLDEATVSFRGAGYRAFDGSRPSDAEHAGIAADYAHVTAPLRRLVDRWGLACCVALDAGEEVPEWVRASLYDLPEIMAETTRRASAYERATVDVVEAALLSDRVGQVFSATVVDVDEDGDRGLVLVPEPAVRARVHGQGLEPGTRIDVRVAEADVAAGRVVLERA
ncbi:RNB domain-containing ribonuclease [Salsipaludibacter albus]|uniref:RNB domain-containing ribonuclease n=1 Tax=Salsipaludibacter albus TaxID=2849650 RepID=UPI001EE4E217|nr:RNB domain-containing ribonuclease [Salsipaludibacter albus]MBY5161201.1 RNB domain-containing ribonuclease [Salsipaludibacter albus]